MIERVLSNDNVYWEVLFSEYIFFPCFSDTTISLLCYWQRKTSKSDPTGPLVCFEGLLSLYGNEVKMFNDMIVAVEDLRSVEFTLILVEKRAKKGGVSAAKSQRGGPAPANGGGAEGGAALVTYSVSSFPLPRVTGSRSHLKGTAMEDK
jgi:hypothetical protein